MPRSTEPAFGQVWRYNGRTLWMIVSPAPVDPLLGEWEVVYLSATSWPWFQARMRGGRRLTDRMGGFPSTGATVTDTRLERVA